MNLFISLIVKSGGTKGWVTEGVSIVRFDPVIGSEMLLYNLARENHIEERDSEANEYPNVVAEIKKWLKENPGNDKRIVIPHERLLR